MIAGHVTRETSAVERGAGTAITLGLIAVVAFVGLFVTSIGAAHHARWQAQTAADLSALAGATAFRHGLDHCAVAAEAATRNQATVAACELQANGQVLITISHRASAQLGSRNVKAIARAGPRY